ncbi:Ig-like domain-containing protein [Bacillus dakarensis]|uniref:Ig-like domain-containing protein n=1 Tax=Robertmurraya dakarensis TaxID=1926278 RepID=UPI000981D131|nr:Ig-like domain-containing protein [Bacillus dakarensis]
MRKIPLFIFTALLTLIVSFPSLRAEAAITYEELERPQALDMEEHEELPESNALSKNGLPMIGTTFGPGFRIQPIGVDRTDLGVSATFEFGNVSDQPITLTNESVQWIYWDDNIQNMAYSYIGDPKVVQPNEVITFHVTTSSVEAQSVMIDINGFDGFYDFSLYKEEDALKSLKPVDYFEQIFDEQFFRVPSNFYQYGTEELTVLAKDVKMTDLKSFGPLSINDHGMIGFVKVRVANLTNEDVNIDQITVGSWHTNKDDLEKFVLSQDDIDLFGDEVFPESIPSRSIVEGYLPFFVRDMNEISLVYVETDSIDFQLDSIESFSPYTKDELWREWDRKESTDVKKPWTIQFSAPVDHSTVSDETIYVQDLFGHPVDVNLEISEDSKSIIVTPVGDYTWMDGYNLFINEKVKSMNGENMETGIKMRFDIGEFA